MSTDQRDPSSKPPGETPPEKPKAALSITQVIGGALAAMTAAALGSRVGVAGTVVGAALASVVAAVASTVYTSSLRRTSKTVSTVWRTRVRPDGHGGTTTVVQETTPDGTTIDPAPSTPPTWAEATTEAGPGATDADVDQPAEQQRRRPRVGWKPVVVTAVLAFAVAAVALTGLELATGRALSGGDGTTVGQVAEGRGATTPDPSPTPTRTPSAGSSASPTAEPTAVPTAEPSATAASPSSSAPSAEPTPTTSEEPTASESATPQPSASPSAPVTPRGPAGSGGEATP